MTNGFFGACFSEREREREFCVCGVFDERVYARNEDSKVVTSIDELPNFYVYV
jgi:hypothetical protein